MFSLSPPPLFFSRILSHRKLSEAVGVEHCESIVVMIKFTSGTAPPLLSMRTCYLNPNTKHTAAQSFCTIALSAHTTAPSSVKSTSQNCFQYSV